MPRKKRISVRNICRENATPGILRVQNDRAQENVLVGRKEVAGFITSSDRKQRYVANYQRKNGEVVSAANFSSSYHLVHVAASNISTCCSSISNKAGNDEAVQHGTQTLFSPTFLTTNVADWEMTDAVEMPDSHYNVELIRARDAGVVGLPSDVSALYIALNNSKLVLADENKCESLADNAFLEDTDDRGGYGELDECFPYSFIKNLPELSSIVPTFRPVLLPKQTRSCPPTTLVLDLDETLVHSALEPCDDADFAFSVNVNLEEHVVFVRCRPHLRDFLDRVSALFEIIIFTASQKIYAEQLLNLLDPKKKIFRHRVYRESCVYVDGNYLKDLSVLGRDLARVVIVDNSPQAFGFQLDNGVPIDSWFDDRSDHELLSLMPFLESLVGVDDVRPLIAEKYNLRNKIDSAGCPPFSRIRGILF